MFFIRKSHHMWKLSFCLLHVMKYLHKKDQIAQTKLWFFNFINWSSSTNIHNHTHTHKRKKERKNVAKNPIQWYIYNDRKSRKNVLRSKQTKILIRCMEVISSTFVYCISAWIDSLMTLLYMWTFNSLL